MKFPTLTIASSASKMHSLLAVVIALLGALSIQAQTLPAGQPASTASVQAASPTVRWFPIYARFAPDDSWVVVNLCSYHNPLYCRIVRWEPDGPSQPLEGSGQTTGRWTLIAGQDPDKSYIWPTVSWNGKKLAFVVAQCKPKDKPESTHPLAKLDCAFYNGQPAMSESVNDLKQGQKLASVYSAARPAWRPDDQAVLYWRTIANVTLASGRSIGHRDIYEYDFSSEKEAPKFDREKTKVMWSSEATGPFYAPDGKTFAMCGYGFLFPESLGLQAMIQCIQVNSTDSREIKGLNTVAASSRFGWILGDWKGLNWVTNGEQVRLIEKRELVIVSEILTRRLESGQYKNTAPNGVHLSSSGDAVIVSSTLWRARQPIAAAGFWDSGLAHAPPAPLLSRYFAEKKDLTPVFWPNVDQRE